MSTPIRFQATEIANRILNCKEELVALYHEYGYQDEANELLSDLARISEDENIKIVFIGPYTAGKSTIISALTGRKDIVIDSDIATDTASNYTWSGGVVLTDTPGLYTENPEHTQITVQTIREADLLVYCITSDLFNQYTKKDFINWAFEIGYAGKMFLVVNKMSKESGNYATLRQNYLITLNRSLTPHSVYEFAHSFVDAKDYKDGIDCNDSELIAISHFEEFVDQLNRFIQQKGHLGKLDTPIKILKGSIDNMSARVINDEQNRAFCALLSRIEKKVDQRRSQVVAEARSMIRRRLTPIVDKGYELSQLIGISDITFGEQDLQEIIEECCEQLNAELCILLENSVSELNRDIEQVMQSDTATYFFNAVEGTVASKKGLFEAKDKKVTRAQFDAVSGVIESITGKTVKMATKGGSPSAGFFIKASEASGSSLHKAVKAIGKTFKVKFKPYGAVNIAKKIGNVAKFAGPVLSVIGFIFDAKEVLDEADQVSKIYEQQIQYRQIFKEIFEDLEHQYSKELDQMLAEYSRIVSHLNESRESVQKVIRSNDHMTKRMAIIRASLTDIQHDVF